MDRRLIRMAVRLQTAMQQWRMTNRQRIDQAHSSITQHLHSINRTAQLSRRCSQRRWEQAYDRLRRRNVQYLDQLQLDLVSCRTTHSSEPREVSLRYALSELQQLAEEFDRVILDGDCLCVRTEPITLEGRQLGPFDIILALDEVARGNVDRALRIRALDPRPAASCDAVTHPHVSDELLCAGEAAAAMHNTLRNGHCCDYFLLVRSVLTTYNADSPYVSLEKWDGQSCFECGDGMGDGDSFWCESCEHEFCDDCCASCEVCSSTSCMGCKTNCPLCKDTICTGCLSSCARCEQPGCKHCLEDSRCATCKEKTHEETNAPIATASA